MAIASIPSPQSVAAIVRDVCRITLDLALDDAPDAAPAPTTDNLLTGRVRLTDTWEAIVTLRSSQPLARLIASRMFGADPDALSEADLHDAFGEIINIVAGNLKRLFLDNPKLSLPEVVRGDLEDPPDGEVGAEAHLDWQGEPLLVNLVIVRRRGP